MSSGVFTVSTKILSAFTLHVLYFKAFTLVNKCEIEEPSLFTECLLSKLWKIKELSRIKRELKPPSCCTVYPDMNQWSLRFIHSVL